LDSYPHHRHAGIVLLGRHPIAAVRQLASGWTVPIIEVDRPGGGRALAHDAAAAVHPGAQPWVLDGGQA
jgi:hypothetical protein